MDKFIPSDHGVSSFVTPPDYVPIVLIVNATDQQLIDCMTACQTLGKIYLVYIYDEKLDKPDWLAQVTKKADVIINAKVQDPREYFTK